MSTAIGIPRTADKDNVFLIFSLYTFLQVNAVISLGHEITRLTDSSFRDEKTIDGKNLNEIHGKFWLWVIGAYEIVRTMKSRGDLCWNEEGLAKIQDIHSKLVKVRVPFAKQEKRGKSKPIETDLSISGFDGKKKDYVYFINGKKVFQKKLIQEFLDFTKSMDKEDIKQTHLSSFND